MLLAGLWPARRDDPRNDCESHAIWRSGHLGILADHRSVFSSSFSFPILLLFVKSIVFGTVGEQFRDLFVP